MLMPMTMMILFMVMFIKFSVVPHQKVLDFDDGGDDDWCLFKGHGLIMCVLPNRQNY